MGPLGAYGEHVELARYGVGVAFQDQGLLQGAVFGKECVYDLPPCIMFFEPNNTAVEPRLWKLREGVKLRCAVSVPLAHQTLV